MVYTLTQSRAPSVLQESKEFIKLALVVTQDGRLLFEVSLDCDSCTVFPLTLLGLHLQLHHPASL